MNWSACMEHLQCVLKEFNGIATLTDNLLIWSFWDSLKLFICAQLDKKDHDLDDWQAVIEQAIDTKAKTA